MGNRIVKYAALNLTHNCNLRCRYCYAGAKTRSAMSASTALQALEFLHEQANGRTVVTFFGGEPLLELELIKKTVAASRANYGRAIDFRMSTNGTLLSAATLDYLQANEIHFVVSLDGNETQHDLSRCLADGRGSYRRVAEQVDAVLQRNPYTLAVSVVTPDTVPFMADGVQSLFTMGFRYVVQTLDYSADWNQINLREMKRQYRELAAFYCDALMSGRKIFYSLFDERIKTWAQKPYGNGDLCDLANSQIAIAPSGRIYPCVQFVGEDQEADQITSIGNVFDGFDQQHREWFIEQNYREKESCHDCALRGRCATYCGCVNWRATGRLDRIPPIICEHERLLMPIVDRLANRLWRRNSTLFKRKFYEPTFPVSSYLEDCHLKREGNNA